MQRLLKYLTLYDKILIVSLIIVNVFFILFPLYHVYTGNQDEVGKGYIVIRNNGKVEKKIPVARTFREDPLLIEVEGRIGTSIIEAINGEVRLKEAPPEDPQKICEKTGWISRPGPSIICVPNQISITIEAGEDGLDGVSW